MRADGNWQEFLNVAVPKLFSQSTLHKPSCPSNHALTFVHYASLPGIGSWFPASWQSSLLLGHLLWNILVLRESVRQGKEMVKCISFVYLEMYLAYVPATPCSIGITNPTRHPGIGNLSVYFHLMNLISWFLNHAVFFFIFLTAYRQITPPPFVLFRQPL